MKEDGADADFDCGTSIKKANRRSPNRGPRANTSHSPSRGLAMGFLGQSSFNDPKSQSKGSAVNPIEALMMSPQNRKNTDDDAQRIMKSLDKDEYLALMNDYEKKKYRNNRLRLRYNPQQLNLSRAIKAQTICEEGGFVNKESRQKVMERA